MADGAAKDATEETIIILPPPFEIIFGRNNFVNIITDVPSTLIKSSSSSKLVS